MAIKYKIDILSTLKSNGYSTYKLRKEKLLAESTIQKMRESTLLSWSELNTVCYLLNVQPGDLMEYVPDENPTPE